MDVPASSWSGQVPQLFTLQTRKKTLQGTPPSLVVRRVSIMKRNVPGSGMKKTVSGVTVWLQSEATSSLDEPWRIGNVLHEAVETGSYRNGT